MGIQAPTGLRFYLNDGGHPIAMGETGIYELDFENIGRIYNLKIERSDLADDTTKLSENSYLVIDIVYEGGN